MKPEYTPAELRELAALDPFGLLEEDEKRALAAAAASSGEAAAAIAGFREVAAELAWAAPEAAPPAHLEAALLERIRAPRTGFTEWAPGIQVLRAGTGAWRKTPFEGVTFQELHFDPETAMATSLLRLAPGSQYPGHRHTAEEQCLVLEGKVSIGDLELSAGDYERAAAATVHGTVRSETGCLLLIVACRHDELLAG